MNSQLDVGEVSISLPESKQYDFGTPLREVDLFAFPRTGSHFLYHCLSGLFDLISRLPPDIRSDPEATSRQNELNAAAVYGLGLRQPGVPFRPMWVNPLANGVHGSPVRGQNPCILLIRHPLATLFSAWRARERLNFQLQTAGDLQRHLDEYEAFYDAGWTLLHSLIGSTLLVRYEDLLGSPAELDRIANFFNVAPKLEPQFVHWLTRFENLVADGRRTFYREGNDEAWKSDGEFLKLLGPAGQRRDFERFGYQLAASKLQST